MTPACYVQGKAAIDLLAERDIPRAAGADQRCIRAERHVVAERLAAGRDDGRSGGDVDRRAAARPASVVKLLRGCKLPTWPLKVVVPEVFTVRLKGLPVPVPLSTLPPNVMLPAAAVPLLVSVAFGAKRDIVAVGLRAAGLHDARG